MSGALTPVDVLLAAPYPSYHLPLQQAQDASRSGDPASRAWAIELLTRLMKRYPHVLAIGQELVLALMQQNEHGKAEEVLAQLDKDFTSLDEETQCRWGRLFKDRGDTYVALPWSSPAGGSPDYDNALRFYKKSIDRYKRAYLVRSGYYPGINLATLNLIVGTLGITVPGSVPQEVQEAEALAQSLLETRSSWPVSFPEDEPLWHPATMGEAYLLFRQWDAAARQYREAIDYPRIKQQAREAMYKQVERIRLCFGKLGVAVPPPLDDPKAFFFPGKAAAAGSAGPASLGTPGSETPGAASATLPEEAPEFQKEA